MQLIVKDWHLRPGKYPGATFSDAPQGKTVAKSSQKFAQAMRTAVLDTQELAAVAVVESGGPGAASLMPHSEESKTNETNEKWKVHQKTNREKQVERRFSCFHARWIMHGRPSSCK